MKTVFFSCIFFLCSSLVVLAQNPFKFEHITVNEGLSHSDAMAVLQDKEGFIWVGTNKGLDRYDGYELKNYRLSNRNVNAQYSNRILTLHLAKDGTFWVVPEAQGVYYFDTLNDSFKNLAEKAVKDSEAEILNSLTVRSIASAPNGDLLLGTSTQGVFAVMFDSEGKIRKLQKISFNSSGDNALVFSINAEENGKIWVGTVGNGLWQLTKDRDVYKASYFETWNDKIIRGIITDYKGYTWVASEESIIQIKTTDNKTVIRKIKRSFPNITYLFEDSYKRIWVGTRNGLFLISDIETSSSSDFINCSIEHFIPDITDSFSINYHLIHQITEDNFNNLWIAASAGGLNKVNLIPKPFYRLQKKAGGLPNDYTNTICKDKDEEVIWIGTRNGFSKFDIRTKQVTNFLEVKNLQNTPNVDVSSIYDDGLGSLWITTRTNGVYLLNKKTLSLKRLKDIPGYKTWKYAEPISVTKDENGLMWVACFYDGVHIFEPDGKYKFSFTKENSALPSAKLTYLLENKEEGGVWLSTRDEGVVKLKLNDNKLQLVKQFSYSKEGFKTNYIWQLTKSRTGDLWVGTIGGGLHRILKNSEKVESFDKWLPETDVEALQEDNEGNLWIGGNGLYKFDPAKKTYIHFDVADGLQSNSFKVASATKDSRGNLYFGGINGVSYFNPTAVSTNPHPPTMQITRVRILNYALDNNPRAVISGPFSDNKPLRVNDSENDFSIEFVGLNYINPRKQHYEYKLDGYHENWIQLPQGQRVMGFSGLPAGKYTFMVRADNGDGVWTKQPATLKLIVLPPWYKTWWAYTFYSLLALSLIIWYKTTTRRQRELKNKIAIEQVEREKQKELADLKLDFFTNVSHELRTPLTLIMSPAEDLIHAVEPESEAKQKALLVHRQASKLLDLVNQLMDFRKVESGNMALRFQTGDIITFLTEIYLIFKIKADELGITYQLKTPQDVIFLNFDPEKLEIVLSNLLSNAFKYTPQGGTVIIEVNTTGNEKQNALRENKRLVNNFLTISIRDTGAGISEEDKQHIFEPFYQAVNKNRPKVSGTGIGLSLVKEFVHKHDGEVQVESEPGRGSVFSIRLPFAEHDIERLSHPQETESFPSVERIVEPVLELSENKILIVEDNPDLRAYLESIFRNYFETHLAENGKEGLEKASKLTPDIILSDVMMPEMNGLELCEKIKNNPKTAHIPLVLLTARVASLHELEGLESGADDYITKPFNPKILVSKIQSLLNNRKKVQEYFHRQILVEPSEAIIPDADRAFIQNAMQIIENNLTNENFSVQTLVRESGMSQSAFYRKLKNLTGQSVIEFIRDVKLKRAAQLLATRQFRISEVALMVGMEDLRNFRNSFQKLYGVSPSEYARGKEE